MELEGVYLFGDDCAASTRSDDEMKGVEGTWHLFT